MEFVNLEKVLADIAKTLQNDYKKNLGESEIAGTITASVEVMGQEFEIVLDLSDYWIYIEEGRKPGTFPKVNSLVNWVKKRNIPLGGKIKTPEQMAYVIGRHIQKEGIPGKHTLEKTIDKVGDIEDMIAEAFAQDIEDYLNKTI